MLRLERKHFLTAFVATVVLTALTTTATAQGLQLNVSPFSGAISIQNTSDYDVSLDGYQILSAAGQLIPDPTSTAGVGWDSITDTGAAGWGEFAPSTHGLSELNLSASKLIPAGATVALGKAFTAYGTKDVGWAYSQATGGGTSVSTDAGAVHYGGGVTLEVITLRGGTNNIESIQMILRNVESQAGVTFDAYVISSPSGALKPDGFNGFAGHNVPGWGSFAPSANALSELNITMTPTMPGGRYQPLGAAFKPSGLKDLTLELHVIGNGFGDEAFLGDVVYRDQLAGDANGDGVVDIFDVNVVSDNWGSTGLAGDVNFDATVDIFDVNTISDHWGNTSPVEVSAVPEPATMVLMMLSALVVAVQRARKAA
jgi:hypothetical protein